MKFNFSPFGDFRVFTVHFQSIVDGDLVGIDFPMGKSWGWDGLFIHRIHRMAEGFEASCITRKEGLVLIVVNTIIGYGKIQVILGVGATHDRGEAKLLFEAPKNLE